MSDMKKDELAEDQALMGEEGLDLEPGFDELEALRAERDDMRDRFMRALADTENVRKRGERDRREAEQYGATKLARDLLPVYDNLKRAIDAVGEEQRAAASAVIEGIELTMRELITVLTRHGVTPIVPQAGEVFDPQMHQAMFEAPLPGTKAGDIIQVMTEGFLLHDRLLRPGPLDRQPRTCFPLLTKALRPLKSHSADFH